jgi:LCP family protein required for cell wall assembly
MRDMYVPIPGRKDNRLNTAFGFGGPALAIKTINTNFNMNITDYISVDFFAMEGIIDLLGGIPIDVKRAEVSAINQYIDDLNKLCRDKTKAPHVSNAGLQTLSGRQAVAYARIRFVGRDDFERTERQRTILNEIFKQGKSISLTKVPELVNTVLPNVETSLSTREIVEMAIAMLGFTRPEIEQFRIPADLTYRDEWVSDTMLVLKPDIQKNKELLHEFIYGTQEKGE